MTNAALQRPAYIEAEKAPRVCNCGSGESVHHCSAGSQFCG